MGFIVDQEPFPGGSVSARVMCVRADNPSAMTYTGTNTWILAETESSECVVIDPAPSGQHVLDVIDVCANEGLRVGAVVCTHGHPDHTEGAQELGAMTGARVYAPFDGTLQPGSFCPIENGPELRVIALPGHSSDSVGIIYPADYSLFVGDVVFKHGPTVVYYPDGNLTDYMHSLDVLEQLVNDEAIRVFYPGHGYPIEDPLDAIEATRKHRLDRLQQIEDALARGVERDADTLVDAVYVGFDPELRDPAFRSVKAQLLYLDGLAGKDAR
jgi:glyoxylase-like metal-dependent hydrolase (beta-lactamase superfamily II)